MTCGLLSAALALSSAAVAEAATRYAGEAVRDDRVKVTFERERGEVKRFVVRNARFICTDGDAFRARVRAGRMQIDFERRPFRFEGMFENRNGKQRAYVRGKLRRDVRARGAFRLSAKFGRVGCGTGAISWRATKERPRR